MDRGIAVFAINPRQLDRFRDRFSPAGAKACCAQATDVLPELSWYMPDKSVSTPMRIGTPCAWARPSEQTERRRPTLSGQARDDHVSASC